MPETFTPPYPGYDVLAKWDGPSWNEATRRAVSRRLTQVPARRFFSEAEWRLAEAICARLLPQPERAEPIPIVPWLDAKLAEGRGLGSQYVHLPPQRQAWRQGLAAMDDEARLRCGQEFVRLAPEQQDRVLSAVQSGDTRSPRWDGMGAADFFKLMLLDDAVSIYYSHPAAWSEIGFGGPASPRGYVRLELDRTDPWEARRG